MAIDLKVPAVGESITEVLLVRWFKKEGDHIEKDEPLVEIETDKATFELPAPAAGTLSRIIKGDNKAAVVDEVVGQMEEGAAAPDSAKTADTKKPEPSATSPVDKDAKGEPRVMPAARRELEQRGMEAAQVTPGGPGGRILKEDVLRKVGHDADNPASAAPESSIAGDQEATSQDSPANRYQEVVPMSPMRKRIAERLVAAQQNAALLTTFNEIDLSAVMHLRNEYRDIFHKKYNIKLGFMSFFIKACVDALKQFPQINAHANETDIIYHNYCDIGIAVSGGKGLVVPVIRNAERMSFAQIEMAVADFGTRAKDNKISLEELKGGTFTITNGGIFGSLVSTPIINPPQSGILGMHAIQDRPVARKGQVVIRPMMYVALTYDHRIVDGREAVTFLKRIKEDIEEPSRMLIEV